jgi:hypothetical protein
MAIQIAAQEMAIMTLKGGFEHDFEDLKDGQDGEFL